MSNNKDISTFKKLSLQETIAVAKCLEEVCIKNENGFARYQLGWDDARVGNECLPDFSGLKQNCVATIRVKLIGTLERGNPDKVEKQTQAQRLDKIERSIVNIKIAIKFIAGNSNISNDIFTGVIDRLNGKS